MEIALEDCLFFCRNYGATVFIQNQADKKGCDQVLWLFKKQVCWFYVLFMFVISFHV